MRDAASIGCCRKVVVVPRVAEEPGAGRASGSRCGRDRGLGWLEIWRGRHSAGWACWRSTLGGCYVRSAVRADVRGAFRLGTASEGRRRESGYRMRDRGPLGRATNVVGANYVHAYIRALRINEHVAVVCSKGQGASGQPEAVPKDGDRLAVASGGCEFRHPESRSNKAGAVSGGCSPYLRNVCTWGITEPIVPPLA